MTFLLVQDDVRFSILCSTASQDRAIVHSFFDLRRLKAKTKTLIDFIREVQYVDDIVIFSDSALGLQSLLTAYNNMAKRMGLSINIKKTETMSIGPKGQFFIDGMPITSINCFKYLGSIVTSDCSVNAELITRIQAVSCAYGRLRERVFDSHDLTLLTKLKVCVQCFMPLLTYIVKPGQCIKTTSISFVQFSNDI